MNRSSQPDDSSFKNGEEPQQSTSPVSPSIRRLLTAFGKLHNDEEGDDNDNDSNKTKETGPVPFSIIGPGIFKPLAGGGGLASSSFLPSCKAAPPSRQQDCHGHMERILSVDISPDGKYFATASQDSTVRIWRDQQCLATLEEGHDDKYECLRVQWASIGWQSYFNNHHSMKESVRTTTYWLASGGADGVVNMWASCRGELASSDPTEWKLQATMDHHRLLHHDDPGHITSTPKENDGDQEVCDDDDCKDDSDRPQIYVLEWIDDWKGPWESNGHSKETNRVLLTASDDHIHLWTWNSMQKSRSSKGCDDSDATFSSTSAGHGRFIELFSMRFERSGTANGGIFVGRVTRNNNDDGERGNFAFPPMPTKKSIDDEGDDVFGGRNRNPHGLVYVFDAAYTVDLASLGVALSDGTVRLVNGHGVCWNVIQPTSQGHLTSLAWCPMTPLIPPLLVTASGSGELSTWQVWPGYPTYSRAVFSGGHKGPVFGTMFYLGDNSHKSGDNVDGEKATSSECHLSWGMDGRLMLWDATQYGHVTESKATLLDNADYPLFSVSISRDRVVTVGGKEQDGIFNNVGIPVHSFRL